MKTYQSLLTINYFSVENTKFLITQQLTHGALLSGLNVAEKIIEAA